ncbi:MAG TPA: hypothetical protein VJ850_05785 [Candidatus Limnocylindrales bacterium]|nr:hypothetical protein [Candidatus Limnocylindrales bacterium]
MRTARRSGRVIVMLGIVAALAASAPASPVSAADPLAQAAFAVGDVTLFEAPSTGAGSGDGGTWTVESGRLIDNHIKLHVEMSVPAPDLAVESGPAVLFAGLSLYGDAGGDVALEAHVAPVVHQLAQPCGDALACSYAVDISIPTDRLPAAIRNLEQNGKLIWVSADLTLVRTFADGQWLQVLAFGEGPGGIGDAAAGRLGAIEPTQGLLQPAGLFPASQAMAIPKGGWDLAGGLDYPGIVEEARSAAGDTSSPIPLVDVAIHVTFQPACPYEMELFLHDDIGNHVFYARTDDHIPGLDGSTSMPIGSPWYLSLDAGDGTANSIIRLGPIEATGSPVVIDATLDCVGRTGTLALSGAASPAPSPTRPPLGSRPSPATTPVSPEPTSPALDPKPIDEIRHPEWLLVPLALALIAFVAGGLYRRRRPS